MNPFSVQLGTRPSLRLMSATPSPGTAQSPGHADLAGKRPQLHAPDEKTKKSDTTEAIFGSFDGMTSTLGVVAGLLATKTSATHVVAAAIGIAVAATVGMGAGQYLSDGQRNLRKALVMAFATLVGSVLPAIPFLFGTTKACILASIGITLLASAVIGHYRGYLVTYSILVVVSALTIGLSLAVA